MLLDLASLLQPPVKTQGIELSASDPGGHVVANAPARRSSLTARREHKALGSTLLRHSGDRHAGFTNGEVAELRVVAEGLTDRERVRSREPCQQSCVDDERGQGKHIGEYKWGRL